MILSTLLPLCGLIAVAAGGVPYSGNANPYHDLYTGLDLESRATCPFRYGDILLDPSDPNAPEPGSAWACSKSKEYPYPMQDIETLLSSAEYLKTAEFLNITANCQAYEDRNTIFGKSRYWSYTSVCTSVRTPVTVVWAEVPFYKVKLADQKDVNIQGKKTLLPCHVVEPQTLFDVKCVHPWSLFNITTGKVPNTPQGENNKISRYYKGMKRLKGQWPFQGIEKHYCQMGYGYDKKYVCQPTGFMKREVVVYSFHARKMFTVTVTDVPTSCACTVCKCKSEAELLKKQIPLEPLGPQVPLEPLGPPIPVGGAVPVWPA